jgi:RHS repeat-associated protein
LRFAGQYYDGESGLHFNWQCYFDPTNGRYLTPDPIGLAGGINLYAYVQNNPVNWGDPWGLYPGQMPPSPPGYNPDTWVTRVNPNGKWEVYDPETGQRWVAHPEDEGHRRHLDDPDNKGPKKRWPRKTKKKWPGQKRKAYGEQSECDPSGDDPEWTPPINEFTTIDPFGRVVPIYQPIFVFPMPQTGPMPPVFVPRPTPAPVYY